jgi:hypothetical protein
MVVIPSWMAAAETAVEAADLEASSGHLIPAINLPVAAGNFYSN